MKMRARQKTILLLLLFAVFSSVLQTSSLCVEEREYEAIDFGDKGPEVLELQTRLKGLGYYLEGMTLNPENFDADTQRAVELFCEQNQVRYEGTGASAAIQQIILSQSAKAYSAPPQETPGMGKRITNSLMRDTPVFGMVLPMYVILLACIVLIVMVILIVIRSRSETEQTSPGQHKNQADKKGKRIDGNGLIGKQERKLFLQIKYNENVRNLEVSCAEPLTIGRGPQMRVKLDERDDTVSGEHCQLFYRGGFLVLRDFSTNGTIVNGNKIYHSESRVTNRSVIKIGNHEITVEFRE